MTKVTHMGYLRPDLSLSATMRIVKEQSAMKVYSVVYKPTANELRRLTVIAPNQAELRVQLEAMDIFEQNILSIVEESDYDRN